MQTIPIPQSADRQWPDLGKLLHMSRIIATRLPLFVADLIIAFCDRLSLNGHRPLVALLLAAAHTARAQGPCGPSGSVRAVLFRPCGCA